MFTRTCMFCQERMTGKKEEEPEDAWTSNYPLPEVNSYEGNRKKVYDADRRLAIVDAGVS